MPATLKLITTDSTDRNEVIAAIRANLKARSGKAWSVTGGKGTAWGWITIDTAPARRTWHWQETGRTNAETGMPETVEVCDPSKPYGHMGPAERAELTQLLGLSREVHHQGESVPASHSHRLEYLARSRGETPTVFGEAYWD
jgi:hypothetical protein